MSIRLIGMALLITLALLVAACQPESSPPPEQEQEVESPTTAVEQAVENDSPVETDVEAVAEAEPEQPDPTNTPLPPTRTEVLDEGPDQAAILKILQAVARTNRAEERAPTFRGTSVPEPTANAEEVRALADYLPVLGEAPEILNETWINTDTPLRLEDLEGQVVLIEFWTFG